MQAADLEVQCPYCGEWSSLEVEEVGPPDEKFTQDCEVCCRPWVVALTREGEEVSVSASREDV